MDQKFEGTPQAELRLEGRRVVRSDVQFDWGSRLQWKVTRNGQVVSTPPARASDTFELSEPEPGSYQIVLQMWKYVNYRKKPTGEHVDSKYVDVSNTVSFTV